MADLIVLGIIVVIVGAAIAYIVKAKKSGAKCIGCPSGGSCSGHCGEHTECSCGCQTDNTGVK